MPLAMFKLLCGYSYVCRVGFAPFDASVNVVVDLIYKQVFRSSELAENQLSDGYPKFGQF